MAEVAWRAMGAIIRCAVGPVMYRSVHCVKKTRFWSGEHDR
jgi:hypothetical protein